MKEKIEKWNERKNGDGNSDFDDLVPVKPIGEKKGFIPSTGQFEIQISLKTTLSHLKTDYFKALKPGEGNIVLGLE